MSIQIRWGLFKEYLSSNNFLLYSQLFFLIGLWCITPSEFSNCTRTFVLWLVKLPGFGADPNHTLESYNYINEYSIFFKYQQFFNCCFDSRNKDQAEKNCSAIKAQQDLANFESESQDYTVPKFTREEGVPDDQNQAGPKPTDSEPHPYIYVISS